ncbi:hypothetical protein [Spirosoma endbachense]|uniref:Uncharacterized protein n=1 Tax=Spirosoma endbachense TaxID=2666025 RepID=A0A6P1W275_9BACT|nr:hypothetical protein [Spirosoma endbachense]QHV99521.1 hypothetical protein GJR95_32920 [Spirosoma endbachense]
MNRIIRIRDCIAERFSENHTRNFYDFRDFLDILLIADADNKDRLEEPFYTCPKTINGYWVDAYAKNKLAIFVYSLSDPDALSVKKILDM